MILHIYSKGAKIKCLGGELTQQRGALAGLAKGLVPSTHVAQFTSTCNSNSRESDGLVGSLQALHEYDGCIYMQAKHAYA